MVFEYLIVTLLLYIAYTRFYKVYAPVYFYKKQGIPFKSWILPVVGNSHSIIAFEKEHEPQNHPIVDWINHNFSPDGRIVPISGLVLGRDVGLSINRPELLDELLVSKNKYLDKHPYYADILKKVTGDSILFAKSDLTW